MVHSEVGSSTGYHIWCLECVTPDGAEWEEKRDYKRLALLGFARIKLFSVEHELVRVPKKAISASWRLRQYPKH